MPAKSIIQKLRAVIIPVLRVLAVWVVFIAALWLSRGVGSGYLAFGVAALVAGWLWWRWSREERVGTRIKRGVVMLLTLAPLAYLLVPLASTTLPNLTPDPAVQLWPTGAHRAVAVYRFLPSITAHDRGLALVFVHGGPGGYVRDFDRDFFASFASEGFDVVLYDQVGAGRSPLLPPSEYSHEGNINDLIAVLARIDKPVVLVGQSYGASLVTSALVNAEVRKRVKYVVLTEPGKLPGVSFSSAREMSEKTTYAADAGVPPSASVVATIAAPRAMLAALLPANQRFVSQVELVNHYTPEAQRALVANSFCRGDRKLLDEFHPTRFNLLVNVIVSRQARASATPNLQDLTAPVLLLLGECSYIPRGRSLEYFDVYRVARSHWIPGVGHITWGNANGQDLTRQAIVHMVDNLPGSLPNEPTQSTRASFVAAGR